MILKISKFIALAVLDIVFQIMLCAFKQKNMENDMTVVRLETTLGNIDIKLYNETPGHKENFINNVKDGAYDGVLFHRVINEFMVQTGDPSSKTATKGQMLGSSDHGEEIPAEFVYPELFHKRGAIAAARTGDNVNPEKKSSGSQFYIVTGKKYNEQELIQMEKSIQNRQKQSIFQDLCSENRDEIFRLRKERNSAGLTELQEKLIKQTEDTVKSHLFHFTPEQKKGYTENGGTPFLDGSYTVYGEVISGMEVVDSLQTVKTDSNDRPIEDVKIIKAIIL